METRHLRVIAAGLTDVGKSRHHNEDNILVRQDLGLFLVSDGMGGHNAGEVASALTAASMRNFFEATQVDHFQEPEDDPGVPGARRLKAAVTKANGDVHEISTTHPKHRGMGCTVVALSLQPPFAHVAHLGDSRAYLIRDGKMTQLTRDHTLINDILALKPDIMSDDLSHLPKNIVTRAVGIEATATVDSRTEEMRPGDAFLLCSDGLTGMLSDAEILAIIDAQSSPADASAKLIQLANEAGGLDNISAVVIRIVEASEDLGPTERPPAPPTTEPLPPDTFDDVTERREGLIPSVPPPEALPAPSPLPEAPRAEEPAAKEPEAPKAEAPKAEAPEAKAPEAEAPEAKAPETKAPEAKAPETKAPEAEAPKAEAPRSEDAAAPAEEARREGEGGGQGQ